MVTLLLPFQCIAMCFACRQELHWKQHPHPIVTIGNGSIIEFRQINFLAAVLNCLIDFATSTIIGSWPLHSCHCLPDIKFKEKAVAASVP